MATAVLLGLAAAAQSIQPDQLRPQSLAVPWSWQEPVPREAPLRVRIIRGRVTVIRREGAVRIEVRQIATPVDPADAEMVVVERSAATIVEDRYPARSIFPMKECLPPVGSRGDFWTHDVRLEVAIFAPASRSVETEIGAAQD